MKRPILRALFLRPHPARAPAEKFAQKTPGMNWERQGGFPNAIRPEKTESCKKCEIRAADPRKFRKKSAWERPTASSPHAAEIPGGEESAQALDGNRQIRRGDKPAKAETCRPAPPPTLPDICSARNEAPAAAPRRRGRAAGGAPSYRKTGTARAPQKIPTFARIARSSHHKTGGAMRLSGARPGRGAGVTHRRRGRPPGGFGSPKAKRALQKKCSPKCQLCVDSTRNFFQSWQRIQAS